MKFLLEKLESLDPKLHESLDLSWEIALNEWLPALGIKNDSYNSFPHLRNIERYLDRIFSDQQKNVNSELNSFSAIETYILLCSILFHDIGKIEGNNSHASNSRKIIVENWSKLGIVNYEVAKVIGKICEFHEPPKDEGKEIPREYNPDFHTITLDPYGSIRERIIGTLLRLADHLDSAYTRVLPTYLKDFNDFETVGAFRKIITGVSVVSEAHYVKTVIDDYADELEKMESFSGIKYRINPEYSKSKKEFEELDQEINKFKDGIYEKIDQNFLTPATKTDDNYKGLFKNIVRGMSKVISALCAHRLNDCEQGGLTESPIFKKYVIDEDQDEIIQISENTDRKNISLIIENCLFGEKADKSKLWPKELLLTVIMKDVKTNHNDLKFLRRELKSMGLPLQAWLIEYKDQLYNTQGEVTYEPIFTEDYLEKVVDGMWELSSRIFGSSMFSYSDLAAQVRDPDIDKIKLAVRRISILSKDFKNFIVSTDKDPKKYVKLYPRYNNLSGTIWYSPTHWQWLVQYDDNNKCLAIPKDTLIEILKDSKEPF